MILHPVIFHKLLNDKTNGNEPIEWLVLEVSAGSALLLSKYGLDMKCYMNEPNHSTWHYSDIRNWLNKDFYESSFDDRERRAISTSSLKTGPDQSGTNEYWDEAQYYRNNILDWPDEYSSYDHIFLLSYSEVEKYLPEQESRTCKPTESVKNAKYYKDGFSLDYRRINWREKLETNGNCVWWLRTMPKKTEINAECIEPDGSVFYATISSPFVVVRPALRVMLSEIRY